MSEGSDTLFTCFRQTYSHAAWAVVSLIVGFNIGVLVGWWIQ